MSGTLVTDTGGDITGKKSPGATLDYTLDFTTQLAPGDTIGNVVWTADAGVTLAEQSYTDTTATVWVSGGTDGNWYEIVATATGTSGEVYVASFALQVEDPAAFGAGVITCFPSVKAAVQSLRRDRLMTMLATYGVGPVDDAYLLEKLVATEADIARRLRVYTTPRQIIPVGTDDATVALIQANNGGLPIVWEPGYDYDPDMFLGNTWGLIELRHRPIIGVTQIRFAYPSQQNNLFTVPTEWIRGDYKFGRISLVPVQTELSIPLNAYILSAFGGGRLVPLMLQVTYTAGLRDVPTNYPDLLDLIKRETVLSIMEDRFIPQSGSTSADGLSQSISMDMSKYSDMAAKRFESLRSSIGSIRAIVL